jgi:hypothetical protein
MKFEAGNPGRPKGTPNAIPAKIRALCCKKAPEAIAELERLMADKNPAIRLAAAKELLDRGIGKAAQPIIGADEGPVAVKHIISWIKDDKPEAPVSRGQLNGHVDHGSEDPLPWQPWGWTSPGPKAPQPGDAAICHDWSQSRTGWLFSTLAAAGRGPLMTWLSGIAWTRATHLGPGIL